MREEAPKILMIKRMCKRSRDNAACCWREIKSVMAKVQVTDVTVLDNPSPFVNPFQFEITFDCTENLQEGTVPCYAKCSI